MTADATAPGHHRLRPPAVPQVTVKGFWGDRADAVAARTADTLYQRCVEAGMLDQLDPGRPIPELRIPFQNGTVTTQMFWDSDLGKVIETAAYCLQRAPNPELEGKIDQIIELFARLQQPDGYTGSWYLRMQPGKRWTNLRDCHELYCAGHLIEGAVAYFHATGKRKLLDIMCRYADHIGSVLGAGKGLKRGYCGHEEIELALVKLYRTTGNRSYLDLARYFIDERGRQPHFFEAEARARGEDPGDFHHKTHEYNQSHRPVREQDKVVGHAVRAMYLYSGMADIAVETGDGSLTAALERLWADLVSKRLYVTAGLGPSASNEGFTEDYDLPNETAYAETCAAVGLAFWASRMANLTLDGRYGDMLEQALYNGALAGISLDGATFFYENPLESRGDHHRWRWHRCPCCPPNLARLISSIGSYCYAEGDGEIAVHLYGESEAHLSIGEGGEVRLTQRTRYPYDGRVEIDVDPGAPRRFALSLRIPGWCRAATLSVNGQPFYAGSLAGTGYARVERDWRPGDRVVLDLEMAPERIHAHPEVRAAAGRVALRHGPLIYCLEGVDNAASLNRVVLPESTEVRAAFEPGLLGGVTTLRATATIDATADWDGTLYRTDAPRRDGVEIKAIPYFAWDNRDPGAMLVWLRAG